MQPAPLTPEEFRARVDAICQEADRELSRIEELHQRLLQVEQARH